MNAFAKAYAIALLMFAAVLRLHAQPANDNFANAWSLTGQFAGTNGTIIGATRESGEPNHAGAAAGHSAWFIWTAPANGPFQIDTLLSSFDTVLGVYTGTQVNALSLIAANDDAQGTSRSVVQIQAVQGTAYRIAVDAFVSSSGGNYVLNIRALASIAITSVTNGTIIRSGTPIRIDVEGDVPVPPIVRMDFYRNGAQFASDDASPFSAIAANAPAGQNTFYVVAFNDSALSWTSSVVSVSVVNAGVTIMSPTDGSNFFSFNPGLLLSNPIPVTAFAWLPEGEITNVEFFVDGQKFAEDGSPPFAQSWTNVTGGSHRLTAIGKSDRGSLHPSPAVNVGVNQVFIFRGSVWKYLDDGSNQGTNWISPSFDDSSWASGPAELGYGDGDERTVVNGGPPNNRFITTYFRRTFVVTNISSYQQLIIDIKRDDGAVVYVNGREVTRMNLPNGPLTFTTLASEAFDDGSFYFTTFVNPSFLVEGTNTMAVEIHQTAANSTDISFDMDLAGRPVIVFNQAPTVALTNPPDDAVYIAPAHLLLEATAADPDGNITLVEFFADGLKIGESTNAPYLFDWLSPPLGFHLLSAAATDNQAGLQTSAKVAVTFYDEAHTPYTKIISPPDGTVVEGPTNMVVSAHASAIEGVTNVLFLANGSPIGEDAIAPYNTLWNAPFGSNVLQTVAVGANGLQGTSVLSRIVITIPPTNTVAPFVAFSVPAAFANVTNILTSIQVRFSERVQGVDSSDLLINGLPATTMTGSGSNYVFSFPQPPYGEVSISFADETGITDFGWPSALPFDGTNTRWEYNLIDRVAPTIIARTPAAGSNVTNLTQVSVIFSEPVVGVDAQDLLVNGTPAFAFSGSGSNYTFSVSQPFSGTINISWATNHAITDVANFRNLFNGTAAGAVWSLTLDSRVILVQSNANWSFLKGTSEATIPVGVWREHDYNADGWPVSAAPFFYGDPYTNAVIQGTYLDDMRSNYTCIFLRQEFSVPNRSAVESLVINAQFDDGFIAWVNGFEVLRVNMTTTGEIPYTGTATTSSTEPSGAGAAYVVYTLSNAPAHLLTGVNVLTIQPFNQSLIGSDFGFNAQLYAFLSDIGVRAPRLTQSTPPPGIIFALTNLTITFSEPVEGVDAADLLVNGLPAQTVMSTNPAVHTFTFPQPAFGSVIVNWAPDHGIVDLDEMPKPFDGNASSATVHYTLYNPNAPTVASQTPVAGNTVTGLTSIFVRFTEAVSGVDATDFLVNGVAATSVSRTSPSNYIFRFPQPAFGSVSIRWTANHGIADLETPPNDFDQARPGGEWNYLLVDPVPKVALTSPANSSAFLAPADILIQANAADNDGSIVRVEFFEGLNKIGQRTSPPYSLTWSNVGLGDYTLTAVATDNTGLRAVSVPVTISLLSVLPVVLTRGPYLQLGTPTSGMLRWRTDLDSDAVVYYGTDAASLTNDASVQEGTKEHIISISGLLPDTKYYYSIGSSAQRLARGTNYWFVTSPIPGVQKPTRLWVLGDSGTANENARSVRDAYYNFAATNRPADLWLMLGDNAYNSGLDSEYQSAVFDMYPNTLRNLFLWPTIGNHETAQAFTAVDFPYLHIFSLPQNGEAGGVPSGSPRYYSFDYANIHFVCLDSMSSGRTTNTAMVQWMVNDLETTAQEWLIVFFHHPPYTRGNHNSDLETELIQIRQNIVPILESHGVDLVLCGHSHAWERSYLLNGHYGLAGTFSSSMKIDGGNGREDGSGAYRKNNLGQGVVYTVAGSSGQITGGQLNHPAHFLSLNELGSMVIDVSSNRLDALFLNPGGGSRDHFTIVKRQLPPIANNATVVTDEDTPRLITLLGSSPLAKPLSYTIISVPTNGTVRMADASGGLSLALVDGADLGGISELIYTPDSNYFGADSFTFQTTDHSVTSALAIVTITVAPINDTPIADASATPLRSLTAMNNLNAVAVLDGSRSRDIENDLLQYFWSDGALSLATGMVATVTLSVGSHNLVLRVDDGTASSTDGIVINVIPATVSTQPLIDMVVASSLPRNKLNPLLVSLDAANKSFEKGNIKTAINQLQAFQHKVEAQLTSHDRSLPDRLIELAQSIIDSANPAPSPKLGINSHGKTPKIEISFEGLPGKAYIIEGSTDMIQWTALGTAHSVANGKFEFTSKTVETGTVLFYRVKTP